MKTNHAFSTQETTPPDIVSELRSRHRELDAEATRLQKLKLNPHCGLSPDDDYQLKQITKERLAVRDELVKLGFDKDPSPQERRNGFHVIH